MKLTSRTEEIKFYAEVLTQFACFKILESCRGSAPSMQPKKSRDLLLKRYWCDNSAYELVNLRIMPMSDALSKAQRCKSAVTTAAEEDETTEDETKSKETKTTTLRCSKDFLLEFPQDKRAMCMSMAACESIIESSPNIYKFMLKYWEENEKKFTNSLPDELVRRMIQRYCPNPDTPDCWKWHANKRWVLHHLYRVSRMINCFSDVPGRGYFRASPEYSSHLREGLQTALAHHHLTEIFSKLNDPARSSKEQEEVIDLLTFYFPKVIAAIIVGYDDLAVTENIIMRRILTCPL